MSSKHQAAALSQLLQHVDMLTPLTVGDAPEDPGLYAWYGTLNAGPKDWEFELVEGRDEGAEACRQLLQRHATRFVGPPMRVDARGPFSSSWSGTVEDTTADLLRDALAAVEGPSLDAVPEDDPRADRIRIHALLAEPQLRGVLVGALESAVPLLSAPIYVGVAKSLRSRLRTHADQLFKLSAAARTPEVRRMLLDMPKPTFASRAVALGFTPETVRVWTLNLSSLTNGDVSAENLRRVAQTAEWLLNRWHRPLLGRQ